MIYKIYSSLKYLVIATILVGSASFFTWVFPSFFDSATKVSDGNTRFYNAKELAGRLVYIREGCSMCHSMFVRNLDEEVERYGPYTKPTQDLYDYPHVWGSKRTGPDLSNVGLKFSDFWHKSHLLNPRSLIKNSTMPSYPWLFEAKINGYEVEKLMKAMRKLGVPYTDEDIDEAEYSLRDLSKGDALIIYLQKLKPN